MTLKSVQEDLQARTLRAVAGLLGKLDYFASLRQADGSYSHWGLSRVHGEASAQRALAEAHRNLVSIILRTPLHKLVKDVDDSCGPRNLGQVQFLEDLENREGVSLPADPGAGSRRHLNSVLHALSALAKTPR
ncbi:MAG: hypothetical protein WA628_22195 [Terriglobales bacterium]